METGAAVTITSVHPPSRFGLLELNGDMVVSFSEKPANAGWINGGFMLVDAHGIKRYFSHIADKDNCNFEQDILPLLTNDGQVAAYKHEGFWQCMDTPRDVEFLRELRKSPKWNELFG
jgi:glucose-1-phosphate cytidylyltransferase